MLACLYEQKWQACIKHANGGGQKTSHSVEAACGSRADRVSVRSTSSVCYTNHHFSPMMARCLPHQQQNLPNPHFPMFNSTASRLVQLSAAGFLRLCFRWTFFCQMCPRFCFRGRFAQRCVYYFAFLEASCRDRCVCSFAFVKVLIAQRCLLVCFR